MTDRDRDLVGIPAPAFRMPAGLRLGPVRLQVADLDRSIPFYRDILGMKELGQNGETALLGGADSASPIVELIERRGVRPVPRRGLLGLFHVAYRLPDRASLGAFVRHVAESRVPVGMSDHLVSEAIYLSDPDGLGVEVYADRPRSSWQMNGQQITMTTEPLDVDALLGAAKGTSWEGAPAGTDVGHVHLHVGDLDEAEQFYHALLGLDKTVWTYPGALFLSAGGYHHHLGLNTWASGAPPASEDDARLVEWRILLPADGSLSSLATHLASHEARFERSDASIVIRDPWGVGVRVTEEAA